MKLECFFDKRAVFTTDSPEETKLLGEKLGGAVCAGLTILLFGELGMGKTQLTQGLGAALGCERVKSPTFIIIAEHEGRIPLVHADLYRLEEGDVDSLDLDSYIYDGCVLAVEWAERWKSPPTDRLDIHIEPNGDKGRRRLTIIPCGEKAEDVLEKLCATFGDKI